MRKLFYHINTIFLVFLLLMSGLLFLRQTNSAPSEIRKFLSSPQGAALSAVEFLKLSSVNVNTATKEELESLPGIGTVLAGRILEYRNKNGPFESIDGLRQVKGIGPGKVFLLSSYAYTE